jgi:uncharacterized protein
LSTPIYPVSSRHRIASIDILRGFALLGIILVNVLGFNASFFDFGGFYNNLPDAFQQHFYSIYISLTADKFIFLFSFLFGYGINMQYRRFKERKQSFIRFFSRRMAILAFFGLIHILFLWAGDILFLYAMAGFIVLGLRHLSVSLQIVLALLFYFFIGIWLTMDVWISLPDAMSSTCTECLERAKMVYASGTYLECLRLRMHEYLAFRYINAFYYLPKITGVILLGFIASGYSLHEQVREKRLQWFFLLLGMVVVGIVAYFGFEKIVDFNSPFALAVYMTSYEFMNLFVASSYLLIVLLIASFRPIATFLNPIALMGRASLTNYLLQSLLLSVIFYGWGFGLFGQTQVTRVVFFAIWVYVLQVILNVIWFRFYNQGPLEKLWRKWSYRSL